ncbi:hypothetical protein A7X12_01395 [Sphingomonas sp. TDK1]|nr:hypothetical protein A7X12_01395 [Sphingomonas sp. TDK1]
MTIDTAGKVIAAQPIDNFEKLDVAPAMEAVRAWTFRPQTFEGRPAQVVGRVSIAYRRRPIPPNRTIAFPAAAPRDFRITLQRTACYGQCPDYRVTVHGDGRVEFDSGEYHSPGTAAQAHLDTIGNNVLLPGRHLARVDPAGVARLLDRFRDAHFFGLRDEYTYPATDNPTQVLTVQVGKTSKTVTDYIGIEAGMPQAVRDLEDAVDAVAGTARWVDGNLETLAELDAARFNYHTSVAATLTAAAASRLDGYRPAGDIEKLLIALVGRGVPLGARIGNRTLAAILVQAAAQAGSDRLFDALSARDALALVSAQDLTGAFNRLGCSPAIARALVKAGADPRRPGTEGSALTSLLGMAPRCEKQPERKLATARALVELGVPLEARSSIGWTALMGCNSPALAQLLLAHGANPNARDVEGTTALLSTEDDRVALLLLRAGADPRARDASGTVRQQAVKGHMPATLAWLDAHQIP